MSFIQYQDKQRKSPHTLASATRLAGKLVQKDKCDVYVVAKRIMGDYHIGVMKETDFFPYTRQKLPNKFIDILRVRRYKIEGWVRDPNQGVKKDDK